MYLRETSVGFIESPRRHPLSEEHLRFNREAACVSDLFRISLPRIKTASTAKVLIDLDEDTDWVQETSIQRLMEVTISPWRLSLESHWLLDDRQRKQMTLDALHEGLVWLAGIEGWPVESFDEAYGKCLEANLIHEFYWKRGKVWKNPSGTAGVKVFCSFDLTQASIYAVVVDRRKRELGREVVAQVIASAYIVYDTLSTFHWVDDQAVAVQTWQTKSNKQQLRVCDLSRILQGS